MTDNDWSQRELDNAITRAKKACDDRFPRRYRDAAADNSGVAAWVDQFHESAADCPSLLLMGPTGTGKTWQAYGAVRAATTVPYMARAGVPYTPGWKAMTYADFAALMRPRSSATGHDPEEELNTLRGTPLLYLDDLGVAKSSDYLEEVTYRLINGRYEDMKPSIFTTNLTPADFTARLGDRLASRLVEICTQVVLSGSDRRRVRAA